MFNFKVSPGLCLTQFPTTSLLIVGQAKHLNAISFDSIKVKFSGSIEKEAWKAGLSELKPNPTDAVRISVNHCLLLGLPGTSSRHNAGARVVHLSKLITSNSAPRPNEHIVLVVRREDVFASVCAVARCFHLFSSKTQETSMRNIRVEVLLADPTDAALTDRDFEMLNDAAKSVHLTARIVDAPCNMMDVDVFVKEIEKVGQELNIKPVIVRGEELKRRGFGGIYGVGKAAVAGPALAVLSHKPSGATESVAWVGKGIVYDTGGLSMKTKTTMPGMKRDCGGAAGILGAFRLAVLAGFKQNLHAVFCLAENAVGPTATRPDDIHTLYSGKTVEINNTDAEGRLVLADGVVYAARDLQCGTVLDMATLTGAQCKATGKYHAAVVTNSAAMEEASSVAGRRSGDLTHPLPYAPDLHFQGLASILADMKNSTLGGGGADSSSAALFIAAHLGFETSVTWVHVDMAAPVVNDERATGYGPALLNVLFGTMSGSGLLREIAPEIREDRHHENGAKRIKLADGC